MNRQVRIIITATSLLAALSFAPDVSAQLATYDAANDTKNIETVLRDNRHHTEEIGKFMSQIAETRNILTQAKETYNKISSVIEFNSIVIDAGNELTSLQSTVSKIDQMVDTYLGTDLLSESTMNLVSYIIKRTESDLTDLQEYLRDHVLKSENNMSPEARIQMFKDALSRIRKIRTGINGVYRDTMEDIISNQTSEYTKDIVLKDAIGYRLTEELPQTAQLLAIDTKEIIADVESATNRQLVSPDEKVEDLKQVGGDSILDFVSFAIGILGALFFAWNYGKRVKGEGQHQDALYKVGAGLVVCILILQCLKACFF